MDFVAIDFETANNSKSSACAVGIAAVENGVVTETFYSLIDPVGKFYKPNVAIHGITKEDVADAPTAAELWPQIERFFSPHWPIVAHNVPFDLRVLVASFELTDSELWAIDTLQLTRSLWSGSHTLDVCAEHYNVTLAQHHNAADDAAACAEILLAILRDAQCLTPMEMMARRTLDVTRYDAKDIDVKPRKDRWASDTQKIRVSEITPRDGAKTIPALEGMNIVFTGTLSIPRSLAMQMACDAGARVRTSVTAATDILVVGVQDTAIVGDDGMSNKEETAHELNATGQGHVVFVTEAEFLSLFGVEALA